MNTLPYGLIVEGFVAPAITKRAVQLTSRWFQVPALKLQWSLS